MTSKTRTSLFAVVLSFAGATSSCTSDQPGAKATHLLGYRALVLDAGTTKPVIGTLLGKDELPAATSQSWPVIGTLLGKAELPAATSQSWPVFDLGALPCFRVEGALDGAWTARIGEHALPLDPLVKRDDGGILRVRETQLDPTNDALLELHRTAPGQDPELAGQWRIRWSVPPDTLVPVQQAVALGGQLTATVAVERIRLLQSALDPWPRLWTQVEIARLLQRSGPAERTVEAWLEVSRLAETAQVPTEVTRGLRAAAYAHLLAREFSEARALLDQAEALDRTVGNHVGLARAQRYRALIDQELGFTRTAMDVLTNSAAQAWSLGLDSDAALAKRFMAPILSDDGRHHAALTALDEVAEHFEQRAPRVERMWYLNDRARTLMRGMVYGAFEVDANTVRATAARALSIAGELRDSAFQATIHTNLLALEDYVQDREGVRRELLALSKIDAPARVFADIHAKVSEARFLLEDGRLDDAARLFEEVRQLAQDQNAGTVSDFSWRADYGLGQVAAARNERSRALSYFRAALRGLEEVGARTRLRDSRSWYFADRRALVEDTVELLLIEGAVEESFVVLDAARARVLLALETSVELERFPAPARAFWSDQVGSYLELRDRFEAQKKDLPLLSGAARAEQELELKTMRSALAEKLDAAYLYLEKELPKSASEAVAIRSLLAADEALLTLFPLRDRVLAFIATRERLQWCWTSEDTFELAPEELAGMKHLYVVAGTPRLEARLFDGPGSWLIEQVSMSFLPYAQILQHAAPFPSGPAVIVGDPRSDLPFARREATEVAARLTDATLILGPHVRRETVLAQLAGARVFHFAGHGVLDPLEPWDAHLSLSKDEVLTLEDLLLVRPRIGLVVLSGCGTGKTHRLGPIERVSLPDVFLLSGAHAVLAADREIADAEASSFVEDFYRAGGASSPAAAWREAALASRGAGGDAWRAFRVVGRR
jgi:hypothetical protein